MNAEAIYNVTKALAARLQRAVVLSGDTTGRVFIGPLDDPDASAAPIILFLYGIVPNACLRNREHRVPSLNQPPPAVAFQNSLPLDLYYLVTVGRLPGTSEEPLLRVLGFAMQLLQLDPDLTGPAVGFEPVHVSIVPLTTEESSRIWALFPTANFRTSVAYLATPVWIDPLQPVPGAHPVVEDSVDIGTSAKLPID